MRRNLPAPTVELLRSLQWVAALLATQAAGERLPRESAVAAAAIVGQATHRLEALAELVEELAPIVEPREPTA